MVKIKIGDNEAGQRLDRFLRKYLRRAPLSAIYRMIRKDLKLNGKRAREDRILEAGDELTIYMSEEQIAEFAKAKKPLTAKRQFGIAYEDEHVLIVDKPVGLLTHGDQKEKKKTLVNQVCGYLQQKGEYDPATEMIFRPSPLNRLDRNTSGLVIFGKDAEATRLITGLLRDRGQAEHGQIRKYYKAIVCGRVMEESVISGALIKDESRNQVQVVGGNGSEKPGGDKKADGSNFEIAGAHARESISIVRPIMAGEDFSLVEIELVTGRTHQIRAHMASIGHPLAADPKYGDPRINRELRKRDMTTQFLHAYKLEFDEELGATGSGGAPGTAEEGKGILAGLKGKTVEARVPASFDKAIGELVDG